MGRITPCGRIYAGTLRPGASPIGKFPGGGKDRRTLLSCWKPWEMSGVLETGIREDTTALLVWTQIW